MDGAGLVTRSVLTLAVCSIEENHVGCVCLMVQIVVLYIAGLF